MNYRAHILMGALLALGTAACDPDPYEDGAGGAPAIVAVAATDGGHPAEDTDGTDGWSVTVEDGSQAVIYVMTNKLLNPTSVQTDVDDCTPAGGWLVQTSGPAPADCGGTPATWYSCYMPSSPSPQQGASIVLFQSCEATSEDAGGWFDLAEALDEGTYVFEGQVADKGGAALPINVSITVPGAT